MKNGVRNMRFIELTFKEEKRLVLIGNCLLCTAHFTESDISFAYYFNAVCYVCIWFLCSIINTDMFIIEPYID